MIAALDAWDWLFANCWFNALTCCCNAGTFSSILVSTALTLAWLVFFRIPFTLALGVCTRIEVALFGRMVLPFFLGTTCTMFFLRTSFASVSFAFAFLFRFGITFYVCFGSTFGTLVPFCSPALPFVSNLARHLRTCPPMGTGPELSPDVDDDARGSEGCSGTTFPQFFTGF